MRQSIGHETLVLRFADLAVDVTMAADVLLGTVYPERNLKLVVSQRPVDIGRMVAADETAVALIALLAMVGHVDDDGVLLGIALHNLRHDRVVVKGGVVVMAQHLALLVGQLRALVLVTASPEMCLTVLVAGLVIHVLTHQVEDGKIILTVGFNFLQSVVIVLQQSVVQGVQLRVAAVKLQLAEFRIVEEETAAEVIYGFLGLRQKFIGDEGDVVTCLTEDFREERIVAPLALLADDMGGEYVLENKAGEIPAGHDIRKFSQFLGLFQCHLIRSRIHEITILLGMLLAEALADDEHNLWRTVGAGIYLHLVGSMNQLGNLVGSQLIGVDAEIETVDRHVEIGAVLLREGVFHFADGLARHQLVDGHLVVPGSAGAPDEEGDAADAGYLRQESGDAINMNGKPTVERFAEGGKEYRYFPDEMAETAEGGEYLHEDEQQYPAHTTEDNLGREAGCDEVACLAAVGFAHQHEHGRVERGAEIDEAIDISYRHGIQDEIEHTSDAEAYFLRNQSQDGTNDVEVEKQFQIQVVVEFTPSRERHNGSQYAQNIHERKEVSITSYRFKSQAQSLLDVFLPIHIFHIIISHFSFPPFLTSHFSFLI